MLVGAYLRLKPVETAGYELWSLRDRDLGGLRREASFLGYLQRLETEPSDIGAVKVSATARSPFDRIAAL